MSICMYVIWLLRIFLPDDYQSLIQRVRNVVSKIKELWQLAMFRWCVYQTPLLVFGLLLKVGAFDFYNGSPYQFEGRTWGPVRLKDWSFTIWIFILAIPAVWVWRKPILNRIRKFISFLNKSAEEDWDSMSCRPCVHGQWPSVTLFLFASGFPPRSPASVSTPMCVSSVQELTTQHV